ncbi:MAG TPA: PKD domain-containing protein [Thermoplasmata archaeon]|nr:PKD domain-containing protein [Thermoplasmata archaeon]
MGAVGRCVRGVAFLALVVGVALAVAAPAATARGDSPIVPRLASFVARSTASPTYYGPNFFVPTAPLTVFLNASASGGAPPYTYTWDFGDGASQAIQNATHSYGGPGLYVARVTAGDAAGRRATSTVVTGVNSWSGTSWVNAEPTPALGTAPLTVEFALTGMGILPASYAWAFGDGVSSNVSKPTHTYTVPGTYLARLNVSNSSRATATYSMTVLVEGNGPLDALATASIVGLCYAPVWNRVSFQGWAGGGAPVYAYLWQFGEDNATSAGRDATFSYNGTGFHTASLTVVDSSGDSATSSASVFAAPPPCPLKMGLPWVPILVSAGAAAALIAAIIVTFRRERTKRPP